MAIPDYQSIMLPLLKLASDKQEHNFRDAITSLATTYSLSASEQKELLPSGQQPIFDNRVGWARTYLAKAGLLESKKRGFFNITGEGIRVLGTNPEIINNRFLKSYDSFVDFQKKKNTDDQDEENNTIESNEEIDPHEALEFAYEKLKHQLSSEILSTIKSCSPEFFERLVVDVLISMGYGGSKKEAGETVGKSGDEGIDGIIKEDRLGLDIIYIQAKRWENVVGRPEIQKFVGALQGKRAKKGIFITTSHFSREAIDYVNQIDLRVVLIDGESLSNVMIEFGIGTTKVADYPVKRIDSDYFVE